MRNWNKLYATYVKTYNKKAAKSIVGMEQLYTVLEFKSMYTALENDRLAQMRKGTRKVLNITQDLVAKQELYEYSLKQARALKKALKQEFNETYTIKALRLGKVQKTEEFWDLVRKYQIELRDKGLSSADIKESVGQTFFGSE